MRLFLKKSISRFTHSLRTPIVLLVLILQMFSLCLFTAKFFFSSNPPYSYREPGLLGDTLFFFNFYVFFAFNLLLLLLSFKSTRYIAKLFLLTTSFTAAILAGYNLSGLYTIKMPLYISWLLAAGCILPVRWSRLCLLSGSTGFLVFQYHFKFMGAIDSNYRLLEPNIYELSAAALILFVTAILIWQLHNTYTKWRHKTAMVNHMNLIMTQMGQFNRYLQENSFTLEEKATEEERLRITREIHDSAGYVFVNIIALMDAVMSGGCQNQSEELFETIRKQASDGLQETRKILRELRAIEIKPPTSIESIYRLKHMFEDVTGIAVDIETGNISKDYGEKITRILTKIVQEAFTNSVRHGHATHILIHFWQFETYLTMTVTDNGHGAKSIVKGIGLAGMEERLVAVNGRMSTSTPKEGGFRIQITIPTDDIERKSKIV